MAGGAVRAYDARAGVGEIEAADGEVLPFHCTALVDGTRTIEPGTAVEFERAPSHLGRWEATAVSRA
jgi:cold shock CspA family protein